MQWQCAEPAAHVVSFAIFFGQQTSYESNMLTIIDSDKRQYLFWAAMLACILLIFAGVVLTMSEHSGLWSLGCLLVGSLGLVIGILIGR
jgi:uncharacterized membrane protein YcjF (UPF0283 family)